MHTLIALALMSSAQATPTWFKGEWEPYSNAFLGLGLINASDATLAWHGCPKAGYEVVEAKGNVLTIRLAKGSTCTLNDEPPTRMDTVRFTLRENGCDLGVSVYASADALKRNEPSAEGLYGKTHCASGPAASAPAIMPGRGR